MAITRKLRLLRRYDTPTSRCIDVYAKNTELAAERTALQRATFRAETGYRSDVAIDFDKHIGTMDECICVLGVLNQLNLFCFVDDLAVVGDADKIITEDGVEDGGVIELDGMRETKLEIGDGLAIGLLVWLWLVILSKSRGRESEESENEHQRFFHGGHQAPMYLSQVLTNLYLTRIS